MKRMSVALVLVAIVTTGCMGVWLGPSEARYTFEQILQLYESQDWKQITRFIEFPVSITFLWWSDTGTVFHEARSPEGNLLWEPPACYVSLGKITDHDLSTGCSVVGDLTPLRRIVKEDSWVELYRAELITQHPEPLEAFLRYDYGDQFGAFVLKLADLTFDLLDIAQDGNTARGSAIATVTHRWTDPFNSEQGIDRIRVDRVRFLLRNTGGEWKVAEIEVMDTSVTHIHFGYTDSSEQG